MPKKETFSAANLQAAIHRKGFQWTAGRTSVSDLVDTEKKAHLGLRVDPAELAAMTNAISAASAAAALMAPAAAPAAIDWRNNNGDWTTPIRDQQSCGSCVSFATLATIESRIKIVCNQTALSPDFSEAQLFYCGCGNCCGTGWNFPPALDFCKNTGVVEESSFPYTPGNQPCPPGLVPYLKITNWTSLLTTADRKNTLATKGPLVAGMAVYLDFYSYTNGVYRHTSGPLQGYHAVCAVGYDDAQQCWICKNSWGTGWGESGWFKIGYGESIDTQFPFYDVDLACPAPGPVDRCANYLPLLRNVLVAARSNLRLRLCLRYYVCGRGPRPLCTAAIIRVVRAVLAILRECPRYRAAFCRALG